MMVESTTHELIEIKFATICPVGEYTFEVQKTNTVVGLQKEDLRS